MTAIKTTLGHTRISLTESRKLVGLMSKCVVDLCMLQCYNVNDYNSLESAHILITKRGLHIWKC